MTKPRQRRSTAKQELFRALIAKGDRTPLEAARDAGFQYPQREVRRLIGLVAEAQAEVTGATPIATLDMIARYGADAHAASACAALLDLTDASNANSDEEPATVVCPTEVLPNDCVPTHGDGSHFVYADEVPQGTTVHETLDAALEQLEPPHKSSASSPKAYARARLTAMLADPKVADGVKITASKALIKHEQPAARSATARERTVAVVYCNARGPLPPNTVHVYVLATADECTRVSSEVVNAYRRSRRAEAA